MRIRHLCLVAMMCSVVAGDFAHGEPPPKDGYVPDATTAIKIAVVVWTRMYGEKTIATQKPYRAELEDGVWTVRGTMPEDPEGGPVFGGTAFAMIAKADGRILHVAHGE